MATQARKTKTVTLFIMFEEDDAEWTTERMVMMIGVGECRLVTHLPTYISTKHVVANIDLN